MRSYTNSTTTNAVRKSKELILDSVIDLGESLPKEMKDIKWNIKSDANDKLAMNIFISDVHLYELIEDSNGTTTYNVEIAKRRVDHVIDTAIQKILTTGPKNFDEVNFILLGDLIDGTNIYSFQENYVEEAMREQFLGALKYFVSKITLLSHFVEKNLPKGSMLNVKAVAGNHGEMRVKRNHHPVNDNFETYIYSLIKMFVQSVGLENVTVQFPEMQEFLKFQVKGWNFLIRHQYKQKNLGTASLMKKVLVQDKIHEGIDLVAIGHYHDSVLQGVAGIKVLRVGCVSGINDYAETLGEFGNPEQTLIITSTGNLVDSLIPVDLSGIN